MQVRSFALAALAAVAALADTASAQCGNNHLTTTNNIFITRTTAYFSLSAIFGAPTGIRICGLEVRSNEPLGTALELTVYRHATLTDWSQLSATSPVDWCPVAVARGFAAGSTNSPSYLTMASPLEIAPANQMLLAITGNFALPFDASQNISVNDAKLAFSGGFGSVGALSGTLLFLHSATLTFDYDFPAAPVNNSPCGVGAVAAPVGAACGSSPLHHYQFFAPHAFDMRTADYLWFDQNTAVAQPMPQTPIVAPTSPNLGLGDDDNTGLLPIGFQCTAGGNCFDAVSISSNGYIWLGATGNTSNGPTELEFCSEGARFAAYMTDLDPSTGGSIHLDLGTNLARITYMGIRAYGSNTVEVTCQVEITPNSIRLRYNPTGGAYAQGVTVGLCNAVPETPPGSVDFSSGLTTRPLGNPGLILEGDLPFLGSSMGLTTCGIPYGFLSGTLISIGQPLLPGVPLGPLFQVGCEQYVSSPNWTVGLIFSAGAATIPFAIPANPAINGLPFVAQSVAVGNGLFTSSNGLRCVMGNL